MRIGMYGFLTPSSVTLEVKKGRRDGSSLMSDARNKVETCFELLGRYEEEEKTRRRRVSVEVVIEVCIRSPRSWPTSV